VTPVLYGKLVRKVREPARTFFDYFLPLWRKGPISCTGGSIGMPERRGRMEGPWRQMRAQLTTDKLAVAILVM